MNDILRVLGDLDAAGRVHCVKTMISVIMLERKLSETGVAQSVNPAVSQTTISRWANGDSVPGDAHFGQLVRLFFDPWHYTCSFAERYYPSLALEARRALFHARADAPLTAQAPLVSEPSVRIDLHMRPGKLVPGALAHTFTNHPQNPSVFVVLVRDDLPYEEQYRIGWEEVNAHVIQKNVKSSRVLPIAVSLRQHYPDPQSWKGQK